jgi:hypothetical protein
MNWLVMAGPSGKKAAQTGPGKAKSGSLINHKQRLAVSQPFPEARFHAFIRYRRAVNYADQIRHSAIKPHSTGKVVV